MSNKPNPAILRVIKKKVDAIKKLEQNYWAEISNQREKFSNIDPEFENKFENIFPKEQSSLIYGCIDGAVLIRHSENNNANLVQVQTLDIRLEKLLKELPIPYKDGRMINFSAIAKLGPGSTIKIGKIKLNDEFELNNLQVTVFRYNEEERILEWEDALNDVRLAILGINFNVQRENESTPKQETKSILETLNTLKKTFDDLLNTSSREEELQVFLKEHPIIIQPYSKIYPKKKLGEDFITDFVFASTLEQGIKYTFVEIEKAAMPIFTKDGELTAEFNHAQKQTLDWDVWLEQNIDYLRKKLSGLEKPNFLIIAGRSINFDDNNRGILRAWNRRQNNAEFLTFDDISFRLGELIDNLQSEQNKNDA